LHQVGDLFEINVKPRCQKVKSPLFLGQSLHILAATDINSHDVTHVSICTTFKCKALCS